MPYTMHRRQWLSLAALGATGLSPASWAQQSAAPSGQTLKIVVPFAPGASTDALARRIALKLQEAWKTTVIVENKPGAGGSIATNAVIRSAPDGNTVLLHTASILQFPHLFSKKTYQPLNDLVPVARLIRGQLIFAVQPDVPAQSLKEFVALAKAHPGKYHFGSYGNGTTPHIQGMAFTMQAGIDLTHVPYQGTAPLMTALKGRHVSTAMLDVVAANTMKDSLRLLAVTGPERWHTLPTVPTFKELGYEYLDTTGWIGMFMPSGTPAASVQRFAQEMGRILQLPDVQAQIETMGLAVYGSTQEEFQRVVQSDNATFEKIIRETQIRME